MTYTVYALLVKGDDDPFYVGCTSRSPSRRMIEHGSRALQGRENTARGAAILGVLREGKVVVPRVLESMDDRVEAFAAEKRWIAHFGRHDLGKGPLMNQSDGGEGAGGIVLSDAARLRMSASKIGNQISLGRLRPDTSEKFSQSVSAYDEGGKWLSTYTSGRKAAEATGVHFSTISDVCRGRINSARNKDGRVFQFRKGDSQSPIQPITYKGKLK